MTARNEGQFSSCPTPMTKPVLRESPAPADLLFARFFPVLGPLKTRVHAVLHPFPPSLFVPLFPTRPLYTLN